MELDGSVDVKISHIPKMTFLDNKKIKTKFLNRKEINFFITKAQPVKE